MKKVLVIMAVALVLAWSASAMAALKVVGINIYTGTNTLASTDSAGVVSADNWNNVNANTTDLVDDSGTATTIDLQRDPAPGSNNYEDVSGLTTPDAIITKEDPVFAGLFVLSGVGTPGNYVLFTGLTADYLVITAVPTLNTGTWFDTLLGLKRRRS